MCSFTSCKLSPLSLFSSLIASLYSFISVVKVLRVSATSGVFFPKWRLSEGSFKRVGDIPTAFVPNWLIVKLLLFAMLTGETKFIGGSFYIQYFGENYSEKLNVPKKSNCVIYHFY